MVKAEDYFQFMRQRFRHIFNLNQNNIKEVVTSYATV